MKKKILYGIASAMGIFLFVLFSFIVKKRLLVQFDFDNTVRIQNHIPISFDPLLSVFSLIGSFEVLLVVLAIIILAQRKLKSFIIFIFFAGAHGVELFGKTFVKHPGPPFMFFRYDLQFLFPSSYVQTGSSYPSGHSMRTIFLATLLVYIFLTNKHLKLPIKILGCGLISIYVFTMLLSRVSLGEHWSSDVIGGSILGFSLGLLSILFLRES